MNNKIFQSIIIIFFIIIDSFASELVCFSIINKHAEDKFSEFLDKSLPLTGFILSDSHERVNEIYADKFGNVNSKNFDKGYKKTLDNLGFFPLSNDKQMNELLKMNPKLGLYSSFNLHIYKKIDEDETYVGYLEPAIMLDLIGVDDMKVREKYEMMFKPLKRLLIEKFGNQQKILLGKELPIKSRMEFKLDFERSDDLSEFVDKFQGFFEDSVEDNDFIVTGYKDYKDIYADLDMDFDEYDAYWVYSLCDLKFSYEVFNKGRPDAGILAPCNIYMYIEKGTSKLIIGMLKTSNWISIMNIKDNKLSKKAQIIDAKILSIIKSLGADVIE